MEFTQPHGDLPADDYLCENILRRLWQSGDRIPSIRELAMDVQVNPNTVTRYAYLQDRGIIYNRRGRAVEVGAKVLLEHHYLTGGSWGTCSAGT